MADSGPSWPHLGLVLGLLGLPWRLHGAALGSSWGYGNPSGPPWGGPGAPWGHPRSYLDVSLASLEHLWGQQNLLWDTFGAFAKRPLGPLWAHFVASWGPLEPHWAISERFFIETIQYERILGDLYS